MPTAAPTKSNAARTFASVVSLFAATVVGCARAEETVPGSFHDGGYILLKEAVTSHHSF